MKKKRFLKLLLRGLIIAGFLCSISYSAWATPNLQIYIPGATYIDETWVIESYEYELWVVGANVDIEDVKFAIAVPEDEEGTISITWVTDHYLDGYSGDVAEESLLLEALSGIGAMDYDDYLTSYEDGSPELLSYGYAEDGTPVDGNGDAIPDHGVFPTDFYEYFIGDFGLLETVYNYVDDDGYTTGEIKIFEIVVDGYTWADIVAYDHYEKSNGKAQYVKTPFSHDGGGGETAVPEPATALLLGSGLIGLAGLTRKIKK